MSDSGLTEVTQKVLIGANRDVTELTGYGYDQNRLDGIETSKNDFVLLPTDVELSSDMALATLAKNNKRTEATEYVMIEIMARVKDKYGETHPVYKGFKVNDIYQVSDAEFHFMLHRVHRRAGKLVTANDLTQQGLTQPIVDVVAAKAGQFIDLWKARDQAIEDRDAAVQARVEAGNALYKDVANIAQLGKRLWLNKDESKYNDYVLYPNQSGAEEEPEEQQVVESPVGGGLIVNLGVTGIDANTNLFFENTGVTALQPYFAADPTDPPPPGAPLIPPGGNLNGLAGDNGFVEGSKEYLNIFNPETEEGNIKVTATSG